MHAEDYLLDDITIALVDIGWGVVGIVAKQGPRMKTMLLNKLELDHDNTVYNQWLKEIQQEGR